MHDMKQLAKDAEAVQYYDCDPPGEEHHAIIRRLAVLVRDVTDETPVDAEWLRAVSPVEVDGWPVIYHIPSGAWTDYRQGWAHGVGPIPVTTEPTEGRR